MTIANAYFAFFRYIGRRLNEVDKILLQLKLPDSVNRSPRSVSERRFWKGIINVQNSTVSFVSQTMHACMILLVRLQCGHAELKHQLR